MDTDDTKPPKTDDEWLRKIRTDFHADSDAVRENHEEAYDDLRFKAGEQWDDQILAERLEARRPCPTVDHISERVRQVTGDIRLNKPSIKVRPVDGAADVDTAELFTGLIRNIEQQSDAAGAYIRAGDNAATCGEGAFRIITQYADDDVFDQDIRIARINNPLAVVWDRNAREPTRSDAMHCHVLENYTKDAFKAKWPKANTTSFDADSPEDWVSDWQKDDMILVAEYWCKKPVTKTIAKIPAGAPGHEDGSVVDWEGEVPKPGPDRMVPTGIDEAGQPILAEIMFREVESFEIYRYVVNGAEILEPAEKWPGRYIPIVPVFGEEIYVGEKVVRRGMVRMAKDPQRMINYHNAAAIEVVALSPKSPFIATAKQIEDNPEDWDNANTENLAVLTYKGDSQANGPPQRQQAAQVPAALLTLKQESVNDLNSAMGVYPASLGGPSNETSGKAILARERQGDVGTFVYIDNLATAISYAGKILVDLIPRIYDGERIVRILGEDESEDLVEINVVDQDGNITNDLSRGKYDVAVQTGPSYSTKRQEAAESILQFMQTMPQEAAIVMHKLVKNLDWPGADDLAEVFRKRAVAQGIEEPDEEKGDPPREPPPPSPEELETQEKIKNLAAKTEGQDIENAQKALELSLASGEAQNMVTAMVKQALTEISLGMAVAAGQGAAQGPQQVYPPREGGL